MEGCVSTFASRNRLLAHENLSNAVIVYGSVRSGTTMFRLMLGGHPDLMEIGEKRYILWHSDIGQDGTLRFNHRDLFVDRVFTKREFTRRPDLDGLDLVDDIVAQAKEENSGAAVITFHAEMGKILHIFPDSKLLHIVRDPRDVAASAMRLGWAGNAYFAADFWLAAERDLETARALIKPGQLLSLKYEDLASAPEQKLREVCAHLGLDFDPGLLSYSSRTTYDQPNQATIESWRAKLSAAEVALVELRCGALLEERGYTRATKDTGPASRAKQVFLTWDNHIRKLGKDMKNYGVVNVLGARISSKLGLLSARDHFTNRINRIMNEGLK